MKKRTVIKKNKKDQNFFNKIVNTKSRNESGIKDSNTYLNNKNNFNNTLYNNYRNNSCQYRNKKKDIDTKKYNIFSSSVRRNYYKNNNDTSNIMNKSNINNNKIKKNNNNRNQYITINNNYYTIINNTTVNNINSNNQKFDDNNNIFNINDNNLSEFEYNDKKLEKDLNNNIDIKNINSQTINNKIKKNENNEKRPSLLDKIKEKNESIPKRNHAELKSKINYNTYINNSSIIKNVNINENSNNIPQKSKDIFSTSFNKRSRNQVNLNLNKQFNTNNHIMNITFYEDNKFNILNNSTILNKKSVSNRRFNQTLFSRKNNKDSSHKKRVIKILNNNDNIKLSLKQKIHLFQQKKEALIKQYSNKNKMLLDTSQNKKTGKIYNNQK